MCENMFIVNNKDTRTTPLTYFTPCFSVCIVNFEQVNSGWVTNLTHFVSVFPLISISSVLQLIMQSIDGNESIYTKCVKNYYISS